MDSYQDYGLKSVPTKWPLTNSRNIFGSYPNLYRAARGEGKDKVSDEGRNKRAK